MVGIYKITNKVNNKCYIGQSRDIKRRWNQHKASKKEYPLYKAFKKYGIDNFDLEVLEECEISELNERELYYITKYNATSDGYNQTLSCQVEGHSQVFTEDSLEELFYDLEFTSMDKKELASKYNCSERAIRDINNGIYWRKDNVEYPIRKYWTTKEGKLYPSFNSKWVNPLKICPICGKHKDRKSKLCHECNKFSVRKVKRPDKETLFKELCASNFEKVAKKYNVSSNAIRKWCKDYGIPFHSKDYK